MLKNKKAQISELMQDTVCLLIIVFLLIIFFVVSGTAWNWSKKEVVNTVKINSLKDQSHYALQAFLQKPVDIEIKGQRQTITVADLIRLSEIDSSYKAILNSEIRAFDSHYHYIFRITTKDLETQIEALESVGYPRFYIPSKKPILAVLQIEKVKE